jgi:hypothetical protein
MSSRLAGLIPVPIHKYMRRSGEVDAKESHQADIPP